MFAACCVWASKGQSGPDLRRGSHHLGKWPKCCVARKFRVKVNFFLLVHSEEGDEDDSNVGEIKHNQDPPGLSSSAVKPALPFVTLTSTLKFVTATEGILQSWIITHLERSASPFVALGPTRSCRSHDLDWLNASVLHHVPVRKTKITTGEALNKIKYCNKTSNSPKMLQNDNEMSIFACLKVLFKTG